MSLSHKGKKARGVRPNVLPSIELPRLSDAFPQITTTRIPIIRGEPDHTSALIAGKRQAASSCDRGCP